ncbi:MAG TPA: hypothetical protein VFA88_06740 [Gaiellaceae bacterium]|nr:hypothetical protein [Gaiellaceae bacterium]
MERWRSDTDSSRFLARFGGVLVWLEHADDGALVTRPLDRRRVIAILARAADFGRPDREGEWLSSPPPRVVADDLLVDACPPLPVLERIVEVPVLAPDGTIHERRGYHADTRCFLAPADGLRVPPVPAEPTARQLARARRLLLDELLGDFPFAGPLDGAAERAHAVAALLLPLLRGLIVGPTPLHVLTAPTPGTGKTLLADTLMTPLLGHRPLVKMAEARDPDEWRKRLTAKLRAAPPVVCVDNVQRLLDSSALALVITTGVAEDRLLGLSEMVELPVRCVWLCTGNNVTLSAELTRRAVRIRLDAGVELPELRTGFRHPDLLRWAREHRAELVWAALVLGRAWVAAGCPDGPNPQLGGFEEWSRVLGGVLHVAEVPGFLANVDEMREVGLDDELAGFLAAVYDRRGRANGAGAEFAARDILRLAREHLGLDGDDARVLQRAGVRLREAVDRPLRGLVLRRGGLSAGTRRWRVEPVGDGDARARVGGGE